jgi:hypothetical protein
MAADFIVYHFHPANAVTYIECVQLLAFVTFAGFSDYIIFEDKVVGNGADIDTAAGQCVQGQMSERFGYFVCGSAVVLDDVVSYDIAVGTVGLRLSPEPYTVLPVLIDMVSGYEVVSVFMTDRDSAAMVPVAVMVNDIVGKLALSHAPADI